MGVRPRRGEHPGQQQLAIKLRVIEDEAAFLLLCLLACGWNLTKLLALRVAGLAGREMRCSETLGHRLHFRQHRVAP